MLPLQQAFEVKESIFEFIRTTYQFKEPDVQKAFYDFIENPQHGMVKGPFVSLKAPFVSAPDGFIIPLEIAPTFPPYKHQIEAFEKLTTQNENQPKNTLITTGTGSGKTECFLYPILDYCHKHIGEKGIKVIILYPMNALATDQAKRLAETIYNDDRLRGKVTAGLFIGKGTDKKEFRQIMEPDGIIENRDVIVNTPPDILLTNFKMLDYGIMKSENASLWKYNVDDPALLKFIVLDELHTYDGAQGTDVANLLRRLKLRIGIDKGMLCGIGTSATIGSGEDSKQLLCDYASDIFGEVFSTEDVIEEHRVPSSELFSGEADTFLPSIRQLSRLTMDQNETHDDYIARQLSLWGCSDIKDIDDAGDRAIALTEVLSSYSITRDIFEICEETGIIHYADLMKRLSDKSLAFSRLEEGYKLEIIQSLLALIAEAKVASGSIKIPFLPLQVQLWVRELSGIRRIVSPTPQFTWKNDANTTDNKTVALPMYYCRECGASGWIATKSQIQQKFETDGGKATKAFMQRDPDLWLINTRTPSHKPDDECEIIADKLKLDTLDIVPHFDSDETTMDFYASRKLDLTGKKHISHFCPECYTNQDDLSLVGAKSATLASLSVSQLLSSNLDSTSDKNRKTLTFTNGVQDAAHLSGFYMSREYRFTMRASIQKIVETLEKEGSEVTLSSIFERFKSYWKEDTKTPDAYVHRFFPNDYAGEIDLEKNFRDSSNNFRQEFLDEFDMRIFWEIVSEYGLSTSFGRTLERTGSSATYFYHDDIDAAWEKMQPWMNEYMMGQGTKEQFEHFLIGFLERTVIHGGISHPYLENFRVDLKPIQLNWYWDKTHFLNHRFGARERYPQPFVTYKTDRRLPADNAYTASDSSSNWYYKYLCTSFEMPLANVNMSNDFYKRLAEVLCEVGLFDKRGSMAEPNYCISPDKIHVSSDVKVVSCDCCQKSLVTTEKDMLSVGVHCIGNKCPGTFSNVEKPEGGYYRMIYRRERTPRIYAHEHTGLLGRKQREDIEVDFKTRPRPDSINSLVATSTLEMGIDIGDLNTELNVSIPPLTSNYLQRVGRAGRKTGSALILDFAQGNPHDLFFFEEPQEMMSGKVNTPGCYLNAKDILRRHFYAYCFDCWTKEDPLTHTIPATISMLKPDTDFISSPDFFINRISQFIAENLDSGINLKSSFGRHYSESTYQDILIPMYEQFSDNTFKNQVEIAFSRMRQQYLNLSSKMRDIREDIKARHLPSTDDEYKELMSQRSMLHRQRLSIKKRIVLEFMTDEGLLPNYAFPETGITLSASVLGSVPRGESEGKKAEIKEFELVRGASAGLKDLAPGNFFYFDGMKLTVNGINTSDWNTDYGLTRKRFCSKCDCIEDETPNHEHYCPKCGDQSFGSDANVHYFVDLHDVKCNEKMKDAVLDDSTDERDKTAFKTSFHFKFDSVSTAVSYGMKDIPFGIEYVKNVAIVEANLGEASAMDANSVVIDNRKVPVHGFVTCRYCGKSVAMPAFVSSLNEDEQKKEYHYAYCKHKDSIYLGKSDEHFEEVYLSREFHTEAIKILLPVQEIDSDATIAMFKAGLSLGLRYYFQGNPSHICMKEYSEFNRSTGRFDSYVILYDSIPGGTGYLSKLFDTTEFSKVLRLAYEALDNCSCQYNGKDGCYHCVLSYENKFTRGSLSRAKAAELFKRIVEKSDNWETINGSIGSVTRSGGIEESELETRFITSLREEAEKTDGWKFETVTGIGVPYYRLDTISKSGESRRWTIIPQVQLGPVKGVEYTTRPDFMFECVRRFAGESQLPVDDIPQIALYLDGYAYHGSAQVGKTRFFDDFKRREAIHRSGKIISWTMTWEDIDNHNDKNEDSLIQNSLANTFWTHPANRWGKAGKSCVEFLNDYSRFMRVLTDMDANRFGTDGLLFFLSLSDNRPFKNWMDYLSFDSDEVLSDSQDNAFRLCRLPKCATWANTRIVILPDNSVKYAIETSEVPGDLDKDTWNHFWRVYNLLNLAKEDMFVPETTMDIDVDSVLQNFDDELHDMVRYLLENNVEFEHDGGFFLFENGELCAEAPLGIESKKVVVAPYDGEAIFKAKGYTVLQADDIEKLKEILA